MERTIRNLRTELTSAKAAHADLEDEHLDMKSENESLIATQKSQLVTFERQVDLLREELERSKELVQQQREAARQWREQLEELENLKTTSRTDDDSWGVIREELHRESLVIILSGCWLFHYVGQTAHIKELETVNLGLTAEVHTLRSKSGNVEILKQANADLENKVRKLEGIKERAAGLEAEVDAARKEREQWCVIQIPRVSTGLIICFTGLLLWLILLLNLPHQPQRPLRKPSRLSDYNMPNF